jgi:hypothetical protein
LLVFLFIYLVENKSHSSKPCLVFEYRKKNREKKVSDLEDSVLARARNNHWFEKLLVFILILNFRV